MEPGKIKKLDEVVVNRIAAGEIIQRPANALKEMIENSLDAKSTSIQITVKNGGIKYLQIQDNGTGIRREDLEIVCERFTTSKLSEFEDLRQISTYGFRGEALASISHVAHLTIQTKTNDPQIKCAYKAQYSDGKLLGTIKPVAGSQGTQITVEDLFYNISQRREAFKSANEEYQKIVNIVSKYAVHNSHVNFALKKIGDSIYSVRTTNNNNNNLSMRTQNDRIRENIRCIYGQEVAKELLEINLKLDERLNFEIDGFITNINYTSKKYQFLLFINHRLVESSALKQQIDQIYSFYLPKGSYPFLYLSLKIRPENVDVNVHPTKHEVHFLYEDEIIGEIKLLIERTLLGKNESRKFYTQKLLPGVMDPVVATKQINTKNDDSMEIDLNLKSEEKIYAKDMVRTDAKVQKLEKFFGNATLLSASDSQLSSTSVVESSKNFEEQVKKILNPEKPTNKIDLNSTNLITPTKTYRARRKFLAKQTKLTSILKIRKSIEENCDLGLRQILCDLIYVGTIDPTKSLIQHETKLYLCNTSQLSEEIYYQILLYDFENFGAIELENPEEPDDKGLPIRELAKLALECPNSGWTEEDGPIPELAETVTNVLIEKSQMLNEYYNIIISDDGYLKQLPLLLENHRPSMAHLPMYILRLATEVSWDNEEEFFDTFSRETAKFYASTDGSINGGGDGSGDSDKDNDEPQNIDEFNWKWYVEHVLYAALKEYFLPPKEFMHNKTFLQVTDLSSLYKVFERC